MYDYTARKFYSVFDYTGSQNIFAIPTIQQETGEKVSSRFINFRIEYKDDLQAGEKRDIYVWHMAKKLVVWSSNMAMNILE